VKELEDNSYSITLNEGDILYHPAGIWHKTNTDTDSISINLSMKTMRMGDFIG